MEQCAQADEPSRADLEEKSSLTANIFDFSVEYRGSRNYFPSVVKMAFKRSASVQAPKAKTKRDYIVDELIESEQVYLSGLHRLDEVRRLTPSPSLTSRLALHGAAAPHRYDSP